jgi:crotonobetainyl-CoA:carnitine CoA-transferase CaiB-like acyl-CoA transferase
MAGSLATMVLSDFGAEVTKIEAPQKTLFNSAPQSRLWDRGKKSVIIDLKSLEGQKKTKELATQHDIVIHNFRPKTVESFDISYKQLSTENPRLVYCSITGFGPKGPYANYKGYEGIVAAKSGRFMAFNGQNGREGPNYSAVNIASYSTAMAAIRGIVAALSVRDKTGIGQLVETSLLQCIATYDMHNWIVWQMMIKDPDEFPNDPQGDPNRLPNLTYLPALTKDGRWIQLANLLDHLFINSIRAMDLEKLLDDPRFSKLPVIDDENREIFRKIMLNKIKEKTLNEWMDIFVEHNVGAEPFMNSSEALNHPQILHNDHVININDPLLGKMRQLGPLISMDKTPPFIKGPAPLPGENNNEFLNTSKAKKRINFTKQDKQQELPKAPFDGLTVIDCSTIIAGPLGASLFGEMGARVIRIEPLDGDWMRKNVKGVSANRTMAGTESIAINLKKPEGISILEKLVKKADIFIHNMRPGAPERLGIGYNQLTKINPEIIYLYVGGYGSTGPYSHRPAFHPIPGAVDGGALAQAGAGIPSGETANLNIEEIQEISRKLWRANEANPDPNTSMAVATALTLAYYAKERHKLSQYLELTMLCANAYANADDFFEFENKAPRTIPDENGYGLNALYRLYEAKDGWIFIACPSEKEWKILCYSLKRQDLLENPKYRCNSDRFINDSLLINELKSIFKTKEAKEWEIELTEKDIACVKAEDRGMYHFFAEDDHVTANNLTVDINHPRFGELWRHGPTINFNKTPGRVNRGPLKGENNLSVLMELGYSNKEVQSLYDNEIIDSELP